MKGLISLDEALEIVFALARPLPTENVLLANAHDRTLSEPVVAAIASPRNDSSAMDGYAVRGKDVEQLPAKLRVTGESFAGTAEPPALSVGTAVRIFTGAPVPAAADMVIIQENCSRNGDTVTVCEHGSSLNIRQAGQDFAENDELLPAGARLNPRALVAAAGADLAEFKVVRRPKVAILSTGDELTPPGQARGRVGTIPESITPALAAMVLEAGGEVVRRAHLPDALEVLACAARDALVDTDLVIVTGGASVGERDHAKEMFGEDLELLFSKVAIKPGKPVWLGQSGKILILGLPGNPTSALVTARLFLLPLVSGLAGRAARGTLDWREGTAGASFGPNGSRESLARATWIDDRLFPLVSQDSSSQIMLYRADVLVRRKADAPEVMCDEQVHYVDF